MISPLAPGGIRGSARTTPTGYFLIHLFAIARACMLYCVSNPRSRLLTLLTTSGQHRGGSIRQPTFKGTWKLCRSYTSRRPQISQTICHCYIHAARTAPKCRCQRICGSSRLCLYRSHRSQRVRYGIWCFRQKLGFEGQKDSGNIGVESFCSHFDRNVI